MDERVNEDKVIPRKTKRIFIPIFFIFILGVAGLFAIYTKRQKAIRVANQLVAAQVSIDQRNYIDAIVKLTQVIDEDPHNAEAYRLRSIAYNNSRSNDYSLQLGYYLNSIRDLDKLIELQPNNGDNYAQRNLVLRELALLPPDYATQSAIYELANDNVEKAIELGVSPDYSYAYRHHARNLIETNHCEEGLKETQLLIDDTNPQDPLIGTTYNVYLTIAYICLGDLEKALETAQNIECNDSINSCRLTFLIEIYFQSGEYDKALELLNYWINLEPGYRAWRYFLRALIFYEKGEKELAIQDLTVGDNYSWYGNGVYWYVKAKMAFDEGDKENGILYLQYAETTLDVQYTPLRQKILNEIVERGGLQPLILPKVPFETTPIP